MRFAGSVVPLLATALLVGCVTPRGKFVWADDYAEPAPDPAGYVIQPGDTVWVRVFNQEGMSAKGKVRADGMLAVPFLNDVQVAGFTPNVLSSQLQSRLKDFINAPQVTVSVEELHPVTVAVLGEVAHPGQVVAESGMGVLQLLAACGGLTEFGHRDRVFVLRQGDKPVRIRFDLDALLRGESRGAQFRMRQGDVLVVE